MLRRQKCIESKAFLFLILLSSFAQGQVINADRIINSDTQHHRWSGNMQLSFSGDKQKRNVFDLSTNAELYRFLRSDYALIMLFKNDAVFLGKESVQNEGMLHVRFRDRDTRKISPEFFTQYQWNGAWGMEYRRLIGGNVRVRVIERKKSDLYLSTGLFGEWERWSWAGVKTSNPSVTPSAVTRSMLRLNQYVKYAIRANDVFDVSFISYLQLPVSENFFQPRWFLDVNAYLRVSKRLSAVFHWDHIMDKNRAVPIDDFYYGFSTGFQITW
jgi:hypothetical protein